MRGRMHRARSRCGWTFSMLSASVTVMGSRSAASHMKCSYPCRARWRCRVASPCHSHRRPSNRPAHGRVLPQSFWAGACTALSLGIRTRLADSGGPVAVRRNCCRCHFGGCEQASRSMGRIARKLGNHLYTSRKESPAPPFHRASPPSADAAASRLRIMAPSRANCSLRRRAPSNSAAFLR